MNRNFYPAWDISTFKRYFHCIMRAQRSALDFQRRNKPRNTQIATIRRFWRRLRDVTLPFEVIPRLNALFTPFYKQNVVHSISNVETIPETRKSQPFVGFDED